MVESLWSGLLLYRRVHVPKVQILYFNNPGGSYVVKSWTFVPLFQPNFLDIRYDWPAVICCYNYVVKNVSDLSWKHVKPGNFEPLFSCSTF